MTVTVSTSETTGRSNSASLPAGVLLGLWLIGGLILVTALGRPVVSRTQEARVLETARQMLGTGWDSWMSPMLNGEPRLKKPPLSYWMSAGSYVLFGVGETAGRLPTAILGWLTLGATYVIAGRMFDRRVALVSAAALLGSYFFFRFMRLAETDAPATFFLTVAIGSIWYAANDPRPARWFHLAAIATALIILSKGAPAIFVLVFFVGYFAVEKRWELIKQFATSGAPVTLLVIAVPWFLYVNTDQFASELRNTTTGGDHWGLPFVYIPGLLVAAAPWSAILPLAIYDAIRRWRTDAAARALLLWFAAILLPLCINGNKQNHYLLMLTPPLMILVGRLLVELPERLAPWIRGILFCTVIVAIAGAVAIPFVSASIRGNRLLIDWLLAILLAGVGVVVLVALVRLGTQIGILVTLALVPLLMPVALGMWYPTVPPRSHRTLANEIHGQFGDRRFVFFGANVSLPLCFNLRSAIPSAQDEKELLELAAPGTIVIAQTKNNTAPPPLPPQFVKRGQIAGDQQTFEFYELMPQ